MAGLVEDMADSKGTVGTPLSRVVNALAPSPLGCFDVLAEFGARERHAGQSSDNRPSRAFTRDL